MKKITRRARQQRAYYRKVMRNNHVDMADKLAMLLCWEMRQDNRRAEMQMRRATEQRY